MRLLELLEIMPVPAIAIITPLIVGVCPMVLLIYLNKPNLFIYLSFSKILLLSFALSLPIQLISVCLSLTSIINKGKPTKLDGALFAGTIIAFGEISFIVAYSYIFDLSLHNTLITLIGCNAGFVILIICDSIKIYRRNQNVIK